MEPPAPVAASVVMTSAHGLFFSFTALTLLVACGSSGTTSSSTTGSTTTAATTGTGGAGGASTTTGTGGAGGNPTLINGCDPATAVDHTADVTVDVAFGDAVGFKYDPACIKIKAHSSVAFAGTFAVHPLAAGTVDGVTTTPDPTSPITETTSGTTATFAFPSAGTFPYFCEEHYSSGMKGVVFVVE